MDVKLSIDVVEYLACSNAVARCEHRLTIKRVSVDALDGLRTHKKWIQPVFNVILSVLTAGRDVGQVLNEVQSPIAWTLASG